MRLCFCLNCFASDSLSVACWRGYYWSGKQLYHTPPETVSRTNRRSNTATIGSYGYTVKGHVGFWQWGVFTAPVKVPIWFSVRTWWGQHIKHWYRQMNQEGRQNELNREGKGVIVPLKCQWCHSAVIMSQQRTVSSQWTNRVTTEVECGEILWDQASEKE